MANNDQFFTRADWRPGKRHTRQLRTKPWGGRPGYRICTAVKRNGEPCGMLALADTTVCGAHGGFGIWARRGKLKKSGKKAALRAAAIEGQSPSAPPALARLAIYRQADQRMRMKLVAAYQTPSWAQVVKSVTEPCV
jgi:hypothetical protein